MDYTDRETLKDQIRPAAFKVALLEEVASDPGAPWWALWEVVFVARYNWWRGHSIPYRLCQLVLANPALSLLSLEEPAMVSGLYHRCQRLIDEHEDHKAEASA